MDINNALIKNIKRNDQKYKKEKLLSNEKLQKEFYTSYKKYEKSLEVRDSYEVALWIESNEKHLTAIKQHNTSKYKLRGDIIN